MILSYLERSNLTAIFEGSFPRDPAALHSLFERKLVGWDEVGGYRITRAGRDALRG